MLTSAPIIDQSPVLGPIDSHPSGHHGLLMIFALLLVFFALFYYLKRRKYQSIAFFLNFNRFLELFADRNRAEIIKLNQNVQ